MITFLSLALVGLQRETIVVNRFQLNEAHIISGLLKKVSTKYL